MNQIDLIKLLLDDNKVDNGKETFLEIGEMYQIRTVTMIYTGKLKAINSNELLLQDCCWIPETNRWADSCKEAEYSEVEPYYNDVILSRGSVLDITKIHKLPSEQK